MRLGVFGGTFDPPHLGHLAVAEEARDRLGLDSVLFVPARMPPHKPAGAPSPAAARMAMVRAAVRCNPGFAASDLELRRAGPSYTADTLAEIAAGRPGAELFCLVGSDSAIQLDTWHEPARLYALAAFVALIRPGWPPGRIEEWRERQPEGLRPRMRVLEVPGIGVSASDIRDRVARGRSIRYLVPGAVAEVIAALGLYRPEGGAERDGR